VRECQLNVNQRALEVDELVPLVQAVDRALVEYRRIGGAPDRAPGDGGLS
jgi:hypothetical protein